MRRGNQGSSAAGGNAPSSSGKRTIRQVVTASIVVALTAGVFGPVAADGAVSGLPVWDLVPDLLSDPTDYEEGPVPVGPQEGHRIVVKFEVPSISDSGPLLRVARDDGAEVMHAYLDGWGRLFVSDGAYEDGSPRPRILVDHFHGEARVDIILEGTTYVVEHSENGPVVTARAFHPATVGHSADTSDLGARVPIHSIRHFPEGSAVEDFHRQAFTTGWTPFGPPGSITVQTHKFGYFGSGQVYMDANGTLDDLAFMHAPVDAYDGRYIVGAAVRTARSSLDPDIVPDHQALVSGISGPLDEPTVNWAIVVDQVNPRYDRWSLFHIDGAGHRTQIGPTWWSTDYHSARVFVDETAETIAIQIDDGDVVTTFDEPLEPSEKVAVGDVWRGELWWTGGGYAYYDDLSVSPWPAVD